MYKSAETDLKLPLILQRFKYISKKTGVVGVPAITVVVSAII